MKINTTVVFRPNLSWITFLSSVFVRLIRSVFFLPRIETKEETIDQVFSDLKEVEKKNKEYHERVSDCASFFQHILYVVF